MATDVVLWFLIVAHRSSAFCIFLYLWFLYSRKWPVCYNKMISLLYSTPTEYVIWALCFMLLLVIHIYFSGCSWLLVLSFVLCCRSFCCRFDLIDRLKYNSDYAFRTKRTYQVNGFYYINNNRHNNCNGKNRTIVKSFHLSGAFGVLSNFSLEFRLCFLRMRQAMVSGCNEHYITLQR